MTKQPGLDGRHRDENGEIRRKNGNTQIGTLRDTYGKGFAPGYKDTDKLEDLLAKEEKPSLSEYLKGK